MKVRKQVILHGMCVNFVQKALSREPVKHDNALVAESFEEDEIVRPNHLATVEKTDLTQTQTYHSNVATVAPNILTAVEYKLDDQA